MRVPRFATLLFLVLLGSVASVSAQPCQFWIAPAPEGNNGNPGSFAAPWATFEHAIDQIPDSGCTVWAKDGVYNGRQRMNRRFNTLATFRAVNAYRAIFQSTGTVITIFGGRNIALQGLEVRHSGPGATALVIQIQQADVDEWAEDIVIRDCILHDSWNNDILKINNGARRVVVENNVFYNQQGHDEHMDVNSVTDVVIQDNIFFNDFAGSGRTNLNDTGSFIVIKDSNEGDDGLLGSQRVTVRRNVFLNWQGSAGSNFLLTGEDGLGFHEAVDVVAENNLFIGNTANEMRSAFGVKGCRNITFRNNTVVGDLPGCAYAMRLNQEGDNPVNDNVVFWNNIWSDPTQTMGTGCAGGDDFSDGLASETNGEALDDNLYWNGGDAIPPGDVFSPLVHDVNRTVANPLLNTNQAGIVLPRWGGSAFVSGNTTVRAEFIRLVNAYGLIPANSPARNAATAVRAPLDDVLGRLRVAPDLGAFEVDQPALTINDVSVTEGTGGTLNATFTVTLSATSSQTVTVQYQTANGSATAPADYTAVGLTTLSFTPGQTTRTLNVSVNGDNIDEPNEAYFVNLSNASGGTITDSQGQGTILDDDPTPQIGIQDCTVGEGDSGTGPCTFNLSLSNPSSVTVTVFTTTANGTATAPADYQQRSGIASFPPGQVATSVPVLVVGDVLDEANETFVLNLLSPSGATIADSQGVGTITDNDQSSVSASDVSTVEGLSGSNTAQFAVTLSTPSAFTVTVPYSTANSTAVAGSDYTAASGTLTFLTGETSKTVPITVSGDAVVESDETFFLNLGAPTNATLNDGQGVGTILNDDPPGLSALADFLMLGQLRQTDILPVASTQWFKVRLVAGRSYAASAWAPTTDPSESPVSLGVTWFLDDGVTVAGGTNTSAIEPVPDATGHDGTSVSIIPSDAQCPVSCTYRVRLQATGALLPVPVRLLVSETTLVAPYWTVVTVAAYDAAPQIRNNTSSAVPVVFTAYSSTGGVVCSNSFTVAAHGLTTFGISGGPPGCSVSFAFGSAQIAHQGPPGSITANITTFSSLSGLSFDSPFRLRNSWTSLKTN